MKTTGGYIRVALFGILITAGILFSLWVPGSGTAEFDRNPSLSRTSTSTSEDAAIPEEPVIVHLPTPDPLRAIYMTSCVVATPSWRERLALLIEETELNAVIIDIKDYTGMISFPIEDPEFIESTNGCFAKDMEAFIRNLHERGIYVIARAQVFQDASYTKRHPRMAVMTKEGTIWKDYKGLSFIDVGATEYWDHIVKLTEYTYAIGFDEVNYDYIRYPSDGNLRNIWFSHSGSSTKADMLEKFFAYLRKKVPASAPVISADVFGMTTVNTDDLNIGQVLERTLPYFDYVAPMVYPSHYPPLFNGWKNPNDVPGDVVRHSMASALARANALEKKEAGFIASTSTPVFVPTGKYAKKLRPWLQDFDYGGDYDAVDVRAQIDAVEGIGITSWMLWDPGNHYTRQALKLGTSTTH